MPDSTFWRNLADEFTRLAQYSPLGVNWQYTSGNPGSYTYKLAGDSQSARLDFERLARRAGAALHQNCDRDSLNVWLDELRTHNNDPRNIDEPSGPEPQPDGTNVNYQLGRISNAREDSANRCKQLEMLEMESERRGERTRARLAVTEVELREVNVERGTQRRAADSLRDPSTAFEPGPQPMQTGERANMAGPSLDPLHDAVSTTGPAVIRSSPAVHNYAGGAATTSMPRPPAHAEPGTAVAQTPIASSGRVPRKRGRPAEIDIATKEAALAVKAHGGTGKEIAKVLYKTPYPDSQQVKNAPNILKHYLKSVSLSPNKS